MKDPNEMFRAVFDNSDIVEQWEEKGFVHVGTIFSNGDYDISFPMNSGVVISKTTTLRTIEFGQEMLDLIYKTKQYIINLASICDVLCGKID